MSSPRSTVFDDIYFSPDDGPAETAHVFLRGNNLPEAWAGRDGFTIGELGFGTGLNFLCAAALFEDTNADGILDYVAVEKYPLTAAAIGAALRPFAARLGEARFEAFLRDYPLLIPGFHRVMVSPRVRLTLVFDDVLVALGAVTAPRGVDAWFLDGFAPAKNPDMWSPPVFRELARLSRARTTLATFTVAGVVRRGLAEAGFAVEKRPGFGRKKEMLGGHYAGAGAQDAPPVPRRVAVIGGGLAGTAAAWALRARDAVPVIFEAGSALAAGASGNPAGLCNPRLSAARTAASDVYAAGYARAVRLFPRMDSGWRAGGNLHLAHTPEREKKFTAATQSWGWDEAHWRWLDRATASGMAGVALPAGGVFLPDAGSVDPGALCRAYAADIETRCGGAVMPVRMEAGWRVGDEDFDAVVIAGGTGALGLCPALPLEPVRGQMTLARGDERTAALAVNLCYGGYCGRAADGIHVVGATFGRGDADTARRDADDADNLAKLDAVMPGWGAALSPVGARAAVRTAAKDRFPVAGMIEDGLYISAAHGSHGIVTTLAAGELIADMITGSVRSLPPGSAESLSPHRFAARLRRKRDRG